MFTHFSHVFERGKKYLLTGPSGCGKSTFFAMLLGDETLDEGQIIFREKMVRQWTILRLILA
nr:ATP-binding cassette domain-containing protein [Enterococcus cecorum]